MAIIAMHGEVVVKAQSVIRRTSVLQKSAVQWAQLALHLKDPRFEYHAILNVLVDEVEHAL